MPTASEWSSLEIAKLTVAALTPIVLFGLGIVVSRASRRVEQAQWSRRKVIERRLELFNEMAPKLNDLFCFFLRVGHYKTVTPPDALARKRELDRTFHSNRPLFSREFAHRYQQFVNACFISVDEPGAAAKLRTSARLQREERDQWDPAWEAMFLESKASAVREIEQTHDSLIEAFAVELGVTPSRQQPRAWLNLVRDS